MADWRRVQQSADLGDARAETFLLTQLAELERLVELLARHLSNRLASTVLAWSTPLRQLAGAHSTLLIILEIHYLLAYF